jgi:hypothetical protein
MIEQLFLENESPSISLKFVEGNNKKCILICNFPLIFSKYQLKCILICNFMLFMLALKTGTGMICQSKKLLSWLEGLFIMPHSVTKPVVELLAVLSLSLSLTRPRC